MYINQKLNAAIQSSLVYRRFTDHACWRGIFRIISLALTSLGEINIYMQHLQERVRAGKLI